MPGREDEEMLDHASVLRLDPDPEWSIRRMTYDTEAPNGVLVSQDQRTLYVAETPRHGNRRELRAYPINDDGTLGSYRVLHTFGIDEQGPQRGVNGMCLDVDGNIVACAGWSDGGPGPMIYVFSPTGRVLETHPTPVDDPTNCTFGDADLRTLYITTGTHSSPDGYLYRVRNTGRQGWMIYPSAH